MEKISRKKLARFNSYINQYIKLRFTRNSHGRFSAKQNLLWICSKDENIRDAVRPYGGKVSDHQIVALARYFMDYSIDGFFMPSSIIESLVENGDYINPNDELLDICTHPNLKIERRIRIEEKRAEIDRKRNFYKSWEWKRVRVEVFKRYPPRCMVCGAQRGDIGSDGELIRICVDHIRPISKRWDLRLDISNMQILCHVCREGRGNQDETDWRPYDMEENRI